MICRFKVPLTPKTFFDIKSWHDFQYMHVNRSTYILCTISYTPLTLSLNFDVKKMDNVIKIIKNLSNLYAPHSVNHPRVAIKARFRRRTSHVPNLIDEQDARSALTSGRWIGHRPHPTTHPPSNNAYYCN